MHIAFAMPFEMEKSWKEQISIRFSQAIKCKEAGIEHRSGGPFPKRRANKGFADSRAFRDARLTSFDGYSCRAVQKADNSSDEQNDFCEDPNGLPSRQDC